LNSEAYKSGVQVQLRFQITQHSQDKVLMDRIVKCLNCGNYKLRSDIIGDIVVTKFSDIYNKIIPFFQKFPIEGIKALDFSD
jgi:ribosomal protein L32